MRVLLGISVTMNKLERKEDQKVQPDIRKGQSTVVCGIGCAKAG